MKTSFKKIFALTLFIFLSSVGFSQSNKINIRFIGNCGLEMNDGTTTIYIDFPYKSGAHNYMEYNKKEIASVADNSIFIFTHKHSDHYSKKLLRKLKGKKFGPWNTDELQQLNKTIPSFNIKSFRTQHKVFGISFKHYSYLITWHDKKIFLSGDTENAETIASQNNIDWAFVPVWIFIDAKEKGIQLREVSKMFAIYHIGPKDNITIDGKDTQIKLLNTQGEIISIEY